MEHRHHAAQEIPLLRRTERHDGAASCAAKFSELLEASFEAVLYQPFKSDDDGGFATWLAAVQYLSDQPYEDLDALFEIVERYQARAIGMSIAQSSTRRPTLGHQGVEGVHWCAPPPRQGAGRASG